jgi:hypothetical protein
VYTLKLTVDGKSYTQTVTVKNDPRSPATAAELATQHELLAKLYEASKTAYTGYTQVTAMRSALGELSASSAPAEASAAIAAFSAKLAAVGGNAAAGGRGGGGGGRGGPVGPPPVPNFAGLVGALNRQLESLDYGDLAPTEPMLHAWSFGCADLRTAVASWKSLSGSELATLNAVLTKNGMKAIAGAGSALVAPVCSAASAVKGKSE